MEISAPRLNRRRNAARVAAGMLLAAMLLVAVIISSLRSSAASEPSASKAAIVDQLSLTFPNPSFVEKATKLLEQAGYSVSYYPGPEVTPDLYRQLPVLGYRFIIFRVHAARFEESDGTLSEEVTFFTSEPYVENKHLDEIRAGLISRARYLLEFPHQYYFSITSRFVQLTMKGDFEGASIIVMGCSGLRSAQMARAFISKGAKEVIGWDNDVISSFTDSATEALLGYLLRDRLHTGDAVSRVMKEVGPDPSFGARLVSYPP